MFDGFVFTMGALNVATSTGPIIIIFIAFDSPCKDLKHYVADY